MITLYRKIRLWALKAKWELALWQFIDKLIIELIKNPEELEKKFVKELVQKIHNENINKVNNSET